MTELTKRQKQLHAAVTGRASSIPEQLELIGRLASTVGASTGDINAVFDLIQAQGKAGTR
jgi:hypothetical protein